MNRDILKELYLGSVSLDEAHNYLDQVLDSDRAAGIVASIGVTEREYTAYCHGIGLMQVAKCRYEGWPKTCPRCGQSLELDNGGWLARLEDGEARIIHVDCL